MTIYVHIRGYITVTDMPYDISNALTIAKVKDKLVERGYIEGDMSDEVLEDSEVDLEIVG